MATFILVSGAWHAGWCWERVVPLLKAKGHRAVAPDLLGMGQDPTPLSTVSLAMWADQVAGIARAQPEPVHLVGHSRGGIVISEAAERAPETIAKLVYLTAALLPDGRAISEVDTGGGGADTSALFQFHPNGTFTLDPSAVGPVFYNTTEPAWVERAQQHLGPEPIAITTVPLRLTQVNFGRVPRAYIECALDRILPLDTQRAMQADLPCDPVLTLQTDHSPFYSDPNALAASLLSIAAGKADRPR